MPLNIVFTAPGSYTVEDDGIRGNNISVIRNASGAIVQTFVHPSDTLGFSTITPGVHLTFNVADSFGSADVNVGQLGDLAASPESIVVRSMQTAGSMIMVSRTTITEGGSDASADVTAIELVLSAVSGIGSPGNALETQTSGIEAETDTGGIAIANFGQVGIGGITPDVAGLDVGDSGNITFSTVGTIFLTDTSGEASVHGGDLSGNVTLIALGALADIYAPGNHPSVYTRGGGVTLSAGRNVWLGPGGTEFNNDVLASGAIRITAGEDFRLDGRSDVRTGAFGGGGAGGEIVITAGHNIELDDTTGGLQTIQAFGGDIVLTTGAGAGSFSGGAFIENAAFLGAITTTNNIILNSDTVLIASGGLNTSGTGSVTIRPVTPGLQVDLGNTGVDSPGAIGLSDAEFDLLFTLNVIIGSVDTGKVTFSAPLSPFIVDNLTVHSGNDIVFNSTLSLPRALTLRAGDDVYFSPTSSFTSTSGGLSVFVDNAQDDGGSGGFGTLDGALAVATGTQLTGNLDPDTLGGSSGNDIIDGGGGADMLIGRGGDDWYYVDSAGDAVVELAGEGAADRIFASVSYTLGAGVYVEQLTTNSNTATTPINLTGNELANQIFGNAGANVLDGRGGADTLVGLGGDDRYYVDNALDVVTEGAADGANDHVLASVSYTLGAGAFVEKLTTTSDVGTATIYLTGNAFAQLVVGNAGNNLLDGGGGADTLVGLGGNDWYYVDNVADVVTEGAAEGTADRIFASVSYTLGAGVHVEQLTTSNNGGTAAINLSGNELANKLAGNAGANVLDGRGGADTLVGLGGNDWYVVDTALDVVTEGAAEGTADRIFASVSYTLGAGVFVEQLTTSNNGGTGAINLTGNELANAISGNAGANVLDGKGAADTLVGLAGADTFAFTTALGAGNIDSISDYVVADDTIQLENAVFTGLAAGALAPGAFNTGAAATQADDRIIYNSATGALLFDADGNGAGAAIQFATLSTGLAMIASEFVVI